MELQIIKQNVPVIEFNKEELKIALNGKLEKYKNIVITEENQKDGKSLRKELNDLANAIDTFRKDIKREINEPVVRFENDCKELLNLITEVKTPIEQQLVELEEKRRIEKANLVKVEIDLVIEKFELESTYAKHLDISDKYLLKSTSMSKIQEDLVERATILRQAQESSRLHVDIINTTVEIYNNKLKTKIDSEPFVLLLHSNSYPINDIISKIHTLGKKRMEEEILEEEKQLKAAMENIPVANQQQQPKIIPIELSQDALDGPILTANLKLFGTKAQLHAIRQVMDKIGVKYEKINM